MERDAAMDILRGVNIALKKWGKQARLPYTREQVNEAIRTMLPTLEMALALENSGHGLTKEEVTKLKRQLAVCLNREKARKAGQPFTANTDEEFHDED